MARRSRTAHLDPWRKSAEFRKIASESAKASIEALHARPRCGAARKRDGKPCENPAMKNGRCDLHGGKTPSGRQWHVVQFPDCSTPHGEAKFNRKLRDHKRYSEKRAARLAAMTPERRAEYDAWVRSHTPGAEAARSAQRARADQNAQARVLINLEPSQRPSDTEASRVKAALATAKAKLANLEARTSKPGDEDEGIFA